MISTPGGSLVSNRFWKEIHGLNGPSSPIKKSITTPITKRISTFQQRQSSSSSVQRQQNNSSSSTQTWANDDEFWGNTENDNEPIAPSSLNNKLLQVAQQEQEQEQEQQRTRAMKRFKFGSSDDNEEAFWSNSSNATRRNDLLWQSPTTTSAATPTTTTRNYFNSREQERSVSPTPSLFKNKLFKAAARKEQEQEQEEQVPSTSKPAFSHSTRQEQYNTFSSPSCTQVTPVMAPTPTSSYTSRQETSPTSKRREQETAGGISLSEELASAKKRDEIIKRNNIPIMNPNLLAELKAKHQQRFIDDSDSYKFN